MEQTVSTQFSPLHRGRRCRRHLFRAAGPSRGASEYKILDLHVDGGSNAREGVAHQRDERAITETDEDQVTFLGSQFNGVQQLAHLLGREH